MSVPGPGAARLLRHHPRQPDQRSCGAAVLVVAEALSNDAYAGWLADDAGVRFPAAVLAMHRRTTGPVDAAGRIQAPWTRLLGTPPWAVDRQLTARRARPHASRLVLPWSRRRALAAIRTAAAHDAVPLYVGSVLPRHVVLVLDAGLTTYDPATGRTRTIDPDEFVAARIGAVAWPVPWLYVSPAAR
ncbi:hypothetical protein [Nocardioides sp. LHG3406-4]|uniref:hypothetical protein n=1 Tax=Nocardioides sp. LHG3406-4 TaxID=2804575 RepID=UPI003CF2ED84